MTTDKRVAYLQYINTGILTLILAILSMASTLLVRVTDQQALDKAELVRLKTVQDANTFKIEDNTQRILVLERNYISDLKEWIDNNYIRRPQKK